MSAQYELENLKAFLIGYRGGMIANLVEQDTDYWRGYLTGTMSTSDAVENWIDRALANLRVNE
jgi:hypothetical protein